MDKTYLKIDFIAGKTIDDAVNELLSYKDKCELVCGDFNGSILYSDTVTIDSAYKEITGKTKSEFDKEMEQHRENRKNRQKELDNEMNQMEENRQKQKREFKEKIPELTKFWMVKGREILTEDKWDAWNEIVPSRLNDIYKGRELGDCLEIVSLLNNDGMFEAIKEKLENQIHSGRSLGLTCAMVREFSARGNEFIDYMNS